MFGKEYGHGNFTRSYLVDCLLSNDTYLIGVCLRFKFFIKLYFDWQFVNYILLVMDRTT